MAKSIRTFWNQRPTPKRFQDKRVLRNGRWMRVDPEASRVKAWLMQESAS